MGGGAWKVAYADFVTGMFALFMALWIMSQDEEVMEAVSEYYKNPYTATSKDSPGVIDAQDADVAASRKANFEKASAVPLQMVRQVNEDLEETFVQSPEFKENQNLHVEVVDDGIKISFFDAPNKEVFKADSEDFTEHGKMVFKSVGWLLARKYNEDGSRRNPYRIELEGHTREDLRIQDDTSDSWDMSTSQANIVRSELLQHGVDTKEIVKVAGFGDTRPLQLREQSPDAEVPEGPLLVRKRILEPEDPRHRRVDIVIRTPGY